MKGADAENRAAEFLQQQGLRLLEKNFRTRTGEIDLILTQGDTLVFVEVRARGRSRYADAASSITPQKQGRILNTAQLYLQRYRFPPPCRFDAVVINDDTLEWIPDAFRA